MRRIVITTIAALAVTAPRVARACESSSPRPGLDLRYPPDRTIAADGVLVLGAYAFDQTIEQIQKDFSLDVTLGDANIPGTLEFVTLWSGRTTLTEVLELTLPTLQLAIVWRPAATLTAGEYVAHLAGIGEFGPWTDDTLFTVTADEGPPVAAPQATISGGEYSLETYERACCAQVQSSCPVSSLCLPLRTLEAPQFTIEAIAEGQDQRVYLWRAEVIGGVMGPREPAHSPWPGRGETSWPWAEWDRHAPLRFTAARDEYCVVIGATSFVDGTSAIDEPHCEALPVPHEQAWTPEFEMWDRNDSSGQCVGLPVFEDDGTPYPDGPPPSRGCRSGDGGPWSMLVLLLAWRRRRS